MTTLDGEIEDLHEAAWRLGPLLVAAQNLGKFQDRMERRIMLAAQSSELPEMARFWRALAVVVFHESSSVERMAFRAATLSLGNAELHAGIVSAARNRDMCALAELKWDAEFWACLASTLADVRDHAKATIAAMEDAA